MDSERAYAVGTLFLLLIRVSSSLFFFFLVVVRDDTTSSRPKSSSQSSAESILPLPLTNVPGSSPPGPLFVPPAAGRTFLTQRLCAAQLTPSYRDVISFSGARHRGHPFSLEPLDPGQLVSFRRCREDHGLLERRDGQNLFFNSLFSPFPPFGCVCPFFPVYTADLQFCPPRAVGRILKNAFFLPGTTSRQMRVAHGECCYVSLLFLFFDHPLPLPF